MWFKGFHEAMWIKGNRSKRRPTKSKKKKTVLPTPGIEPGPRRWERRILTTRPYGIWRPLWEMQDWYIIAIDRSERAGTRGKRGCYIRFLRRISRSDAANSNYGAGQQLVHQTVFQARKVMPNNPWRRKMSWSALNALLLFIQTWSYESLMILEIMLLWFCLSLHLMLSSCWQDQAVLLLVKFWWWTL